MIAAIMMSAKSSMMFVDDSEDDVAGLEAGDELLTDGDMTLEDAVDAFVLPVDALFDIVVDVGV